jgi:hypothetical protein
MTKATEHLKSADDNIEDLKPRDNPTSGEPLDPFSPENLRLSQAYTETVAVKKILTTVPVRKPGQQDFVRVRADQEYRDSFAMIDLKDDREEYIVQTNLVSELFGEIIHKQLFLAINRQGTVFFWPVRLPSPEGKDMDWWRSGREATDRAMRKWVRVRANQNLGAYEIYEAAVSFSEPEWPELGYWDLIKIAFGDHLITNLDHPVVQRLRGLK